MSKIIIGIHGLRNKPPKRILKRWWKKSIREGLQTIGRSRWFFRFKLVYWADVFHPEPLNPKEKNPEHPLYIKAPYCPGENRTQKKPNALRKKIRDVLEKQIARIFLNKDMTIYFSGITDRVIRHYFEELDGYYSKIVYDKKGKPCPAKEVIRGKLARILQKNRKKKIVLIAHSMGSIIAYDVLTQVASDIKIDTFVTVGSPLGIPVILGKIASENKTPRKNGKLTTPENVANHWFNFSDLEDKVAMHYKLRDHYEENSHHVRVLDKIVYNNYEIKGEKNPHKSYGYLRTPELAEVIDGFLRGNKNKG